jgi:hypothetical protein
MASLVLSGDTSGSVTLAAPAVAGSTTQTLVNVTGTLAPVVSGTAVTASGTSVDFTSIPSWVKRITVMFSGVSTSGISNILVQLGDSGGFETTGYVSTACSTYGVGSDIDTSTAAFILTAEVVAAGLLYGNVVICLQNTSNNWVSSSVLSGNSRMQYASGGKSLSDTLTQVRITTVNGTDTFDAGSINILYE